MTRSSALLAALLLVAACAPAAAVWSECQWVEWLCRGAPLQGAQPTLVWLGPRAGLERAGLSQPSRANLSNAKLRGPAVQPRCSTVGATGAATHLPTDRLAVRLELALAAGCDTCYNYYVVPWGAGTLGPICMCGGGNATAVFTWSGQGEQCRKFGHAGPSCIGLSTAVRVCAHQDAAIPVEHGPLPASLQWTMAFSRCPPTPAPQTSLALPPTTTRSWRPPARSEAGN